MPVNRKVTLTMVDDHHIAVTGKMVGIDDAAAFDRPNDIAQRRLNVDAFADDFGAELRMLEFAERRADPAIDGPFQSPAHGIESAARPRSHWWLSRFRRWTARHLIEQ